MLNLEFKNRKWRHFCSWCLFFYVSMWGITMDTRKPGSSGASEWGVNFQGAANGRVFRVHAEGRTRLHRVQRCQPEPDWHNLQFLAENSLWLTCIKDTNAILHPSSWTRCSEPIPPSICEYISCPEAGKWLWVAPIYPLHLGVMAKLGNYLFSSLYITVRLGWASPSPIILPLIPHCIPMGQNTAYLS